jgi:hypothetical protein
MRERRLSTTSMDIQQPRKREKRHKNQTFYPCPASFSEPDQYDGYSDNYSNSTSDDDETTSCDSDGYKNTLVRIEFS